MLRSDKISRMEPKVLFSEDPAFVIRRADKFLSSEPVLHNLILSILRSRIAQGDPGRYWIALHGEEAGVTLAGVNGDAATAASLAGQWRERCKTAATPLQRTR